MPNWCENRLNITGPVEEIQRFKNSVKGKRALYAPSEFEIKSETEADKVYDFTFHSLVPVPDDVLAKGYHEAGYDWQSHHWGTKWDVTGSVKLLEEKDNALLYEMLTAWTPPVKWVNSASVLFPTLIFDLAYSEPGMGFAGYITLLDGDAIDGEHLTGNLQEVSSVLIEKLGYVEEDIKVLWEDEEEEEA